MEIKPIDKINLPYTYYEEIIHNTLNMGRLSSPTNFLNDVLRYKLMDFTFCLFKRKFR